MIRPHSSLVLAAVLSGTACAAAPLTHDFSYTFLGQRGDVTVVGDSQGVDRALRFKHGNAPLLWFREGGREYVVRDPATLAQLEAAWTTPRRELEAAERQLESEAAELERQGQQLRSRLEAMRDPPDSAERHELERAIEKVSAQKETLERTLQQKRELGPRNNDVELRALLRQTISAGKATLVS